jgi:hypothetical protein
VNRSRYEKDDRKWIPSGRGLRLPGAVIGYYVDWDLYRLVYMGGILRLDQRVVEQRRVTFR